MTRRRVRRSGTVVALVALLGAVVGPHTFPARAYSPYTHEFGAEQVLADLFDPAHTGQVTIAGRLYTVDTAIVDALRSWPEYYRAGVIGPDGFPDIAYGQTIIHPNQTGRWLGLVLQKARQAQNDPNLADAEKGQILAFTYGFLIHAAGDVWAHTLVNKFAREVFPEFSTGLSTDKLEVALRHIIVEAYIKDATPGFDGNRDVDDPSQDWHRLDGRIDQNLNPVADYSNDETPSIPLAAPTDFIYDTFIDPNSPTPTASRGPILDKFITLRSLLAQALPSLDQSNDSLQTVEDDVQKATDDASAVNGACPPGASLSEISACSGALSTFHVDIPPLVAALTGVGSALLTQITTALSTISLDILVDDWSDAKTQVSSVVSSLAGILFGNYVKNWISDIDSGMHDWGDFGLAISRGLFDPESRRNAQNAECRNEGADQTTANRIQCEKGIGVKDGVMASLDPEDNPALAPDVIDPTDPPPAESFFQEHLLPMLGLPRVTGDILDLMQAFSDKLDKIEHAVSNPITAGPDALRQEAGNTLDDDVKDWYQVDLENLGFFADHPSAWLELNQPVNVPGVGTIGPLFGADDHTTLDAYLGLTGDHHVSEDLLAPWFVDANGGPIASTRLADDAQFDPTVFAALQDTITMSKLALLNGDGLNQVMSDIAGHTIRTFQPADNIMINVLSGQKPTATDPTPSGTSSDPWLMLIDGDHAWRNDGMPVFCDWDPADHARCDPRYGASSAIPRDPVRNGGNGQFPLWEACTLRPAFRTLFTDWENGDVSQSPANNFPDLGDPTSPDYASDPQPPVSTLTVSGPSFTSGTTTYLGSGASLSIGGSDDYWGHAVTLDVSARDAATGTNPLAITPTGPDGVYPLSFNAADACQTEAPAHTPSLIIDTHGPLVICQAADTLWHATDVSLTCAASDAGSGLANTLDASFSLSTSVPAGTETANASTGLRTVCDNLGNCTVAGPITGGKVDKKAPAISLTQPQNGAAYALNSRVTVTFGCSDGGSGVALCSGTQANGTLLPTSSLGTHAFTVNSTDNVGNASSVSLTYSVTYGICLLYDPNKALGTAGNTVPIKLRLCDGSGRNLSSPSITLTATLLDGKTPPPNFSGSSNLGYIFRYDSMTASYVYNLSTKGLSTGAHILSFTVSGGDPVTHTARFTVK